MTALDWLAPHRDMILTAGSVSFVMICTTSNLMLWFTLRARLLACRRSHPTAAWVLPQLGVATSIALMFLALGPFGFAVTPDIALTRLLAWNYG